MDSHFLEVGVLNHISLYLSLKKIGPGPGYTFFIRTYFQKLYIKEIRTFFKIFDQIKSHCGSRSNSNEEFSLKDSRFFAAMLKQQSFLVEVLWDASAKKYCCKKCLVHTRLKNSFLKFGGLLSGMHFWEF